MKITTKTTKEQLKSFLGANAKAVKSTDKALFDRIAYADKMAKTDDSKVTRKDLVDLAKEVISLLGDKLTVPVFAEETPIETVEPVAENSVKKLAKGVSKKQKSMEEENAPEVVSESTETAEATKEVVDKKKSAKKSSKKDDATVSTQGAVQKEFFPETLKVGDTNYELAHDITSMEDLYNALEKDEEIVFAFYWSKQMLKKYPYFYNMLGTPKSFDNDLDLATTIYVSEERKIAYHISMYTEGCYNTLPDDFEEVEGVRYAGTVEFQIYRAV